MKEPRKICFVTGTRAEYGHLRPLLKLLHSDPKVDLNLIVLAMHLSARHGNTIEEIRADNIPITESIDTLMAGDSAQCIANSAAMSITGVCRALGKIEPDLLVLCGDRYEMWSAAQAGLFLGLPMAHIAGGDLTEGAYDDAIRHSITKLSHLHFVTNQFSKQRVIQMGELPKRVFDVGSLCIDSMDETPILPREELEQSLGLSLKKPTILVTYHANTKDTESTKTELDTLEQALLQLVRDWSEPLQYVITKPSLDVGSRYAEEFVDRMSKYENVFTFASLGTLRYFNLLKFVSMVVGNSSSGIYEVPSFSIPTINIGRRQQGRILAESVIQCDCNVEAIVRSIERGFNQDCSSTKNPYGDGGTAPKIRDILHSIENFRTLKEKSFHSFMLNNTNENISQCP